MTILSRIAATAVISGFIVSSAYAHTRLTSSVPADQAVVETVPTEVALRFSEPVRLTAVSVKSGNETHTLDPDSSEVASDFVIALPDLAPGEYVIQWRVLSADTHVMSGEIRFTASS